MNQLCAGINNSANSSANRNGCQRCKNRKIAMRIHIHDRVIAAVCIQIQAQGIGCVHERPCVLLGEPTVCGGIVPCAQIVGLRFRVVVLAAIEERVVALPNLRGQIAEGIVGVACDNGIVLDQLHHVAVGIVDVDLALAVVRAVQPVEVGNTIRNALAGLVHNVHAIVDEILGAAADRLGFPQSARVIGVGCGSCTVAVTGLLSAVVVGVSLIPGGQRIAVCIVGIRGGFAADRFGKQTVVGIVGIGGDRAVSVHADAVAACIIGIGDAVLARGFAGQSAQPVIGIGGCDRVAAEQGLCLGALIAVGIVGIGKFADDDVFPVVIRQDVEHAGDEVGFVIGIGGGDCPRRLACAVAVCIIGIGGLDAVCGDRGDGDRRSVLS